MSTLADMPIPGVSSTPGPGKEEEEVQTEASEVSEIVHFSKLKNDAQEQNTK